LGRLSIDRENITLQENVVSTVQISKDGRFMCPFIKIFLKVAISFTSAMIMAIALQAQAATREPIKPGAVLLAQSAMPQKEQQKSPVDAGTPKEEKLKQEKSREQKMQLEKQAPKTRAMQPPPPGDGTKKFGGGIIRDKESPEGE
jgi:hypothetical protein